MLMIASHITQPVIFRAEDNIVNPILNIKKSLLNNPAVQDKVFDMKKEEQMVRFNLMSSLQNNMKNQNESGGNDINSSAAQLNAGGDTSEIKSE